MANKKNARSLVPAIHRTEEQVPDGERHDGGLLDPNLVAIDMVAKDDDPAFGQSDELSLQEIADRKLDIASVWAMADWADEKGLSRSEKDENDDPELGQMTVPVVATAIDVVDPETAEVTPLVALELEAENALADLEAMPGAVEIENMINSVPVKLPIERAMEIAKEAIARLPKSLRGKYRAWLWDAEQSGVVSWVFGVTNFANIENLRRVQVDVEEAAELTQKAWPTDLFTAKFLTPREKRITGWLPYIRAQIASEVIKYEGLEVVEPTADLATHLFITNPKDREDMNRAIVNGIALWTALDDRAPYGRCQAHGEPKLSADSAQCQKCLKAEKPSSQMVKFEGRVTARALLNEEETGKVQSKNQRWQFGQASTGKHRKKK